MTGRPRVALVVPGLAEGGGVPAVAGFLHSVLERSGRYEPSILSLATSSRDPQSVRLTSPSSWLGGARVQEGEWQHKPFQHVGCYLSEIEFMRYRPRASLTRLLDRHDLVQIVAGSPAWAMTARAARAPVLLQVATLVAQERRAMLARGWDPWRRMMTRITTRVERAALDHVRVAFVENAWMRETLGRWMGPSRVRFAPPGIDTRLFRPGPYRADGCILSVGRLDDPRKNVPMLLRGYAALRTSLPQTPPLVLAGSAGPPPEQRDLVEALGLSGCVTIREAVPLEQLADLYRQASVLVLSSDEEGLGLVILEAMASGIPVVATQCGGPQTSIEEGRNGCLVPVGDHRALAETLGRLLRDPSRRRSMGEQGRVMAEERFSLEAAGRRFLDEYDDLLAGS